MSVPQTDAFAAAIHDAAERPLPPAARFAAERSLRNIIAVVVGAERSDAVRTLASVFASDAAGDVPFGVGDTIRMRGSARDAALVIGFAGHYDDYDDTHLSTVIHPSAACFGAAWALGHELGAHGDAVLRAFAVGVEAQLRLGVAVCPEHYDRGWHITGTCGVIGATVTAALLRGFDRATTASAIALAATHTLGHREAFGSQVKPLHAGLAAAAGVETTSDAGGLDPAWRDGPDPLALVLDAFAPETADHALLGGAWSGAWEIEANTFKPYPCGIVAHPGIDAAVALHQRLARRGVSSDQVTGVGYRAHPLVEELMGRIAPLTALEARFSARHGVAAGLSFGRAGIAEFEQDVARDQAIARLRELVTVHSDSEIARDEAVLTVTLADGTTLVEHVAHARGSADRPLTDEELDAKAEALLLLSDGLTVDDLRLTVGGLHGSERRAWTLHAGVGR